MNLLKSLRSQNKKEIRLRILNKQQHAGYLHGGILKVLKTVNLIKTNVTNKQQCHNIVG